MQSAIYCVTISRPVISASFFSVTLRFRKLIKAASQILRLDWLQQIIGCAVCQSLPCIFKIPNMH